MGIVQSLRKNHFTAITISIILFLHGCQNQSINSDTNIPISTDSELSANQETELVTSIQDPDLTLAAGAQISGPESSLDEELASTPLTSPIQPVIKIEQSETDLWQRVREGMIFDFTDNPRIKVQRDWYEKHQAYLNRVITRARPFLFLIVEEIEKRNMPMELLLLPIVESAFDPFAYSHGRASGMWQFIPSTGRRYGLKQDWWYDGRRDIIESTRAALDYLTYLHKHFNGDWFHALAAYNSGEGNVARAIKRNKKRNRATDFWHLKLPRETEAYVPKLLALVELLTDENSYKLKWKKVANSQIVKQVQTNEQIDIAFAAKLADITIDEFYKLNPGFNRWSTPPSGPHHLLLPIEKAEAFIIKLAASKPSERVRWVRYKIKSGDSLIKIANKHNTTVAIIRSVNHLKGHLIRIGNQLLIPTANHSLAKYSLSSEGRLDARQNIQRGDNRIKYKVHSGDSFWKIARQYNVNLRHLAAWNGMAPNDPLMIGQKLVIWTNQPNSVVTPTMQAVSMNQSNRMRKINYQVRKGDSLSRISSKFSVKVGDLKRWNIYLQGKKYLQPGERLIVYIDITSQSGAG